MLNVLHYTIFTRNPEEPAELTSTTLKRADLSSANLQGTNLSSADLQGASLANTDLYGANLAGADLRGTSLQLANYKALPPNPPKYTDNTKFPKGFNPIQAGMILTKSSK